jgi:MFS family permease
MQPQAVDSRRAWSIALAAFVANVAVFGVLNSFGVFFEAMAEDFDTGRGATAMVFAVTLFIYFGLGIVTGPLADRFGPRPLLAAGAVLVPAGLLLTAAASSIWIGYATYGLGLGVGTACVNVPMLATIGGWFDRQRTAALGLAATGIATGTMVASPVSAALVDATGFRTTYVIYAGIVFAALIACALIVERAPVRSVRTQRTGAITALRHLARDAQFGPLYVSGTLMSMVVFVPLVFLTGYASDHGAGHVEAATLLGVMGGASIIGRLGIGLVAPRIDLAATYRASFVAISAALLLWLSAGDRVVLLWAFAVIFGIAYGAWVAMLPAIVAHLFGLERLGVTLGIVFTGGGVGALLGVPLAGVLIDATGGYDAAIATAMVFAVSATIIVRAVGRKETTLGAVAQPAA